MRSCGSMSSHMLWLLPWVSTHACSAFSFLANRHPKSIFATLDQNTFKFGVSCGGQTPSRMLELLFWINVHSKPMLVVVHQRPHVLQ